MHRLLQGLVVFVIFLFMIDLPVLGKGFFQQASLGRTFRVSLSSSGEQANQSSQLCSISADGRYIAFSSLASNLVVGDTNGMEDIFVHDLETHSTRRVSVASGGTQAASGGARPAISADGHHVAFFSGGYGLDPNHLVPGTVYVHSLLTGETELVSLTSEGYGQTDGSDWPSISGDGRYVAYISWGMPGFPAYAVLVRDRQTDQTILVSVASDGTPAPGYAENPMLSANGHYVAFWSNSNSLVGDDTDGLSDLFIHDMVSGETTRILAGPLVQYAISGDGRSIAFSSAASDLVAGDTNGVKDVFVLDWRTIQVTRVSIDSSGDQANRDSVNPAISADGRYVVFSSYANNLSPYDNNSWDDVYIHDRQTGDTSLVSLPSYTAYSQGGWTQSPVVSAEGRYIAFLSQASDLVSGDTNTYMDAFVRDRFVGETTEQAEISPAGGSLVSLPYHTMLVFPVGAFASTARVSFDGYTPGRYPTPAGMIEIAHNFDLQAADGGSGTPVEPVLPYTITVTYRDSEARLVDENSLGLYFWNGSQWVLEPGVLDIGINTLTAHPVHFSGWALFGKTNTSFLPLSQK